MDNNNFYEMGQKATKFAEIMQNKGQYAIQGHSRSPIMVPIDSGNVGQRM